MTENGGGQGAPEQIVISAKVPLELNHEMRMAVARRRLPSKSEGIRQALRLWMDLTPCPQCDGPTWADGRRPGVRFCPACDEAVIFEAVA